MTSRFAQRSLGLALLGTAAVVLAAGCGTSKPTGTVTGTVKYKGEPVTTGSVNFLAANGQAAQANLDESGNYKIDAIEAGEYKVYLLPPTPGQLPPGTKPAPTSAPKVKLTPKVQDPQQSGVTVTVKAGQNQIPIEFKD